MFPAPSNIFSRFGHRTGTNVQGGGRREERRIGAKRRWVVGRLVIHSQCEQMILL